MNGPTMSAGDVDSIVFGFLLLCALIVALSVFNAVAQNWQTRRLRRQLGMTDSEQATRDWLKGIQNPDASRRSLRRFPRRSSSASDQ